MATSPQSSLQPRMRATRRFWRWPALLDLAGAPFRAFAIFDARPRLSVFRTGHLSLRGAHQSRPLWARRRPARSSIWAVAAVSATSSRPDGRVDGRFWRWRMLIPPAARRAGGRPCLALADVNPAALRLA